MSNQVESPAEAPDVMRANTVAREMFDRIADRWALLVINALGAGTLRFSRLHEVVEGVSHKMLTQTLRGLERDGIVRRRVHPTSPPRVDYALTGPGAELLRAVTAICGWTRDHITHIETAREEFDARRSAEVR